MGEVKRTSFLVLLAGLAGFVLGAAVLGYGALGVGMSLLSQAQGGIHSNWTYVVLVGTLVCVGLGGVVGGKWAARLVKPWDH